MISSDARRLHFQKLATSDLLNAHERFAKNFGPPHGALLEESMETMETELTLKIPSDVDPKYFNYQKNFSLLISDFYDDVSAETDEDYEQFLADIWVGIVLTLMVLCCVCCMCSCLLYHKFQQWKRTVEERHRQNLEAGNPDTESLPSYTIVSGLPSYEEALEQLRKVKELTGNSVKTEDPSAPASVSPMRRLSVVELFQLYRNSVPAVPAATSQKL